MLNSLHIKNIALIDELSIDFSNNLNILSGETGAGKSIIVDSLNLVLGERASKELIKAGCESASVEAFFDDIPKTLIDLFSENGIDCSEGVVFARELSASGKGVCRINGRLVTLQTLKELSSSLVDLHGQHEHQSLLSEKNHLGFLDEYGGEAVEKYLEEIKETFGEYKSMGKELSSLCERISDAERKLDILNFQIAEINTLNYRDGELEELMERKNILQNSEKIESALSEGYESLYGGSSPVLTKIKEMISSLQSISTMDKRYEKTLDKLNEAYYSLEDIAFELRDFKAECYYDEKELDDILNRLDDIHKISRKYGGNMGSALAFLNKSVLEQDELMQGGERVAALTEQLSDCEVKLKVLCAGLTDQRKVAAQKFEEEVTREFNELGLANSRFEVVFKPTAYSSKGADDIEFFISTNAGEPLKPLRKVVSGGEASRIMLALKVISLEKSIATLVFDEIDTGISGKIAHTVAKKLAHLAEKYQTLCVTHLPQIAAKAKTHFLITKTTQDNQTKTNVTKLGEEERISEVARLTGGDTQSAQALARELIFGEK